MKLSTRRQGFTLVEIMIVVVIIGLLAAMAIPAFNKVRRSSNAKAMLNDARQIGSAAQQYFMETGETTVTFGITTATGNLTGPLTEWVKQIGANTTTTSATATTDTIESDPSTGSFSLRKGQAYGGAVQNFDAEGKRTSTTAE
jgi:type IV pilus assembly protein PilA